MKERPIPFSAPMVRALRANTKRQTRRPVRQQPERNEAGVLMWSTGRRAGVQAFGVENLDVPPGVLTLCPYGKPGDRLWTREGYSGPHWMTGIPPRDWIPGTPIWYWADGNPSHGDWTKPKPGMHMPRWASRNLLEVTEVRVERLQDISEADARAEGITFTDYGRRCGHTGKGWVEVGECPAPLGTHPQLPGWGVEPTSHQQCMHSAPAAYASLWEQINGPGSWATNPWVWAVTFEVLT